MAALVAKALPQAPAVLAAQKSFHNDASRSQESGELPDPDTWMKKYTSFGTGGPISKKAGIGFCRSFGENSRDTAQREVFSAASTERWTNTALRRCESRTDKCKKGKISSAVLVWSKEQRCATRGCGARINA